MPAPALFARARSGACPRWLYSWPPRRSCRLAPGQCVRGAGFGHFTVWPRRSCPAALLCACAARADWPGRVPTPSVRFSLRSVAARCLTASSVSFLVRRAAYGAPSHAGWSRPQFVRGAGPPPAPRTLCCPVVSLYTRGFRHQGGMSPQLHCLTPAVRCTVASGLFLSHCPPRLALERARARTRAPDRVVRHESSLFAPPLRLGEEFAARCTVQYGHVAPTLVFARVSGQFTATRQLVSLARRLRRSRNVPTRREQKCVCALVV